MFPLRKASAEGLLESLEKSGSSCSFLLRVGMTFTVSAKNSVGQLTAALTLVLKGLRLNLVYGHAYMVEAMGGAAKRTGYSHFRNPLLALLPKRRGTHRRR